MKENKEGIYERRPESKFKPGDRVMLVDPSSLGYQDGRGDCGTVIITKDPYGHESIHPHPEKDMVNVRWDTGKEEGVFETHLKKVAMIIYELYCPECGKVLERDFNPSNLNMILIEHTNRTGHRPEVKPEVKKFGSLHYSKFDLKGDDVEPECVYTGEYVALDGTYDVKIFGNGTFELGNFETGEIFKGNSDDLDLLEDETFADWINAKLDELEQTGKIKED